MRGHFIVLEGIDGSGTTSQCRLVAERLRSHGYDVVSTQQPSSGPVGVFTRLMLQDEIEPHLLALLFAADRLHHYSTEIRPALQAGCIVLCDRYLLSAWAYQSIECDFEWVRTINEHAAWPDLTLVLDIDPDLAWQRVQERATQGDAPKERFDDPHTQRRVAQSYREFVERHMGAVPPVRVDANGSLEDVTGRIVRAIAVNLGFPSVVVG